MYSLISSEHIIIKDIRVLANQAFSRVAGAPLLEGNHVRLLKNAHENYPAWLEAINSAKKYILFENYLICEDTVGEEFADALIAKSREGVNVRLIYDWVGCYGKTSRRFWKRLCENGIELRCYNPPRLESPFGLLSRDHRKMIAVDGEVSFVTGLCIGLDWVGFPEKKIEPWRDTGVEVKGRAVADIERAFAQVWAMLGDPVPAEAMTAKNDIPSAGTMNVRIVADAPATAGMFRLDQLVAALARNRLWLTDAYFAGTTVYVQALRAVAKDGVDVRLLVPNATNLPIIKPLSRAGYRPLLEAGVRVFEWNGPMLHAKTAVADGQWARVGSTNLNIASWFGNCELDVVVENHSFAQAMEEMYLEDLTNATEVVLDAKQRIRLSHNNAGESRGKPQGKKKSRTTASVVRIGNAIGSSFTGKRLLVSTESSMMTKIGIILLVLAILIITFPLFLSYTAGSILIWLGIALISRGVLLHGALGKKVRRSKACKKLEKGTKMDEIVQLVDTKDSAPNGTSCDVPNDN